MTTTTDLTGDENTDETRLLADLLDAIRSAPPARRLEAAVTAASCVPVEALPGVLALLGWLALLHNPPLADKVRTMAELLALAEMWDRPAARSPTPVRKGRNRGPWT